MPSKLEIKKGDKFSRLTIIKEIEKDKHGKRKFLVRCDCGNKKEIVLESLRAGLTKSCGCLSKEKTRKLMTTHGKRYHRLYGVWKSMKFRCFNKKDKKYEYYGGKGITVCKEWLDIENFINDMYPSYEEGLELDRIDNDKGYSKENCRWVTRQQNQWNTKKRGNCNNNYKGVTERGDKWTSYIQGDYIGTFNSEIEAAKAYDREAMVRYGEYAYLNFKISR